MSYTMSAIRTLVVQRTVTVGLCWFAMTMVGRAATASDLELRRRPDRQRPLWR